MGAVECARARACPGLVRQFQYPGGSVGSGQPDPPDPPLIRALDAMVQKLHQEGQVQPGSKRKRKRAKGGAVALSAGSGGGGVGGNMDADGNMDGCWGGGGGGTMDGDGNVNGGDDGGGNTEGVRQGQGQKTVTGVGTGTGMGLVAVTGARAGTRMAKEADGEMSGEFAKRVKALPSDTEHNT